MKLQQKNIKQRKKKLTKSQSLLKQEERHSLDEVKVIPEVVGLAEVLVEARARHADVVVRRAAVLLVNSCYQGCFDERRCEQ